VRNKWRISNKKDTSDDASFLRLFGILPIGLAEMCRQLKMWLPIRQQSKSLILRIELTFIFCVGIH
jgi:hypothetical protein